MRKLPLLTTALGSLLASALLQGLVRAQDVPSDLPPLLVSQSHWEEGVAVPGASREPSEPVTTNSAEATPAPVYCPPQGVAPEPEWGESDWLTRDRLGGDLGGVRPWAAERGIDGRVESTQFYQGIASGGIDQVFRYGGRNDYYVNLKGEQAGLNPGFFLMLHGESRYGQDITDLDGALLPTNFAMNVPAPGRSITALTAVKVIQALNENFILFGGKLNMLDEYTLNYSSGRGVDRFQNTSLVFQPILSRIVPYSTFGAGAAILHEGAPIASLSILDSEDHSTTSAIDDAYAEGAVILGEGRLPVELFGMRGTHVVGAAWSSRQYIALEDTPLLLLPPELGVVPGQNTGSWATYYNFDQTLWVNPNDPTQTWGLFGTAGIADRTTSPVHWSTSAGLSGNIPWHFRPQDEFGVGYYYLGGSPDLKDALPVLLPLQDGQGVELFYKANVTRWFALTPSVQFIQPGRARVDDSVIVGLRGKVTF